MPATSPLRTLTNATVGRPAAAEIKSIDSISVTIPEAAKLLNVGTASVGRARMIQKRAEPTVITAVEEGRMSIREAQRVTRERDPQPRPTNGVTLTKTHKGRKAPKAIRGAIGTLVGLATGLDSFKVKDAAPTPHRGLRAASTGRHQGRGEHSHGGDAACHEGRPEGGRTMLTSLLLPKDPAKVRPEFAGDPHGALSNYCETIRKVRADLDIYTERLRAELERAARGCGEYADSHRSDILNRLDVLHKQVVGNAEAARFFLLGFRLGGFHEMMTKEFALQMRVHEDKRAKSAGGKAAAAKRRRKGAFLKQRVAAEYKRCISEGWGARRDWGTRRGDKKELIGMLAERFDCSNRFVQQAVQGLR